jgi:uncharacterized protein (TIRG00374 family)
MKWLHRLALGLGVALLLGLLWKIGPMALLRNLLLLGWVWIPLIVVEGLGEACHATAWRHCLSRGHRGLPWAKIAMIRQAGMAFNYLTPTAHLGGELIKGTLLGREGDTLEAATAVIVGKLALVLSQLLLVTVASAVALWIISLPIHLWLAWALGTSVFFAGIVAFFLVQRHGKLGGVLRLAQRIGLKGRRVSALTRGLSEVDQALRDFHRERPGDLLRALLWHVLGYSGGLIQAWLFLSWGGQEGLWKTGIVIWALGAWFDLVGFAVPAGVGVQEGSRVLVFHAVGLDSLGGLTFGVVLRLTKAFWALVGLVCYGTLIGHVRNAP